MGVREYLAAPDTLALGEQVVLVMNAKIAQRSYGSEKRLICPPPSALLLGTGWWSDTNASTELVKPEVDIYMTGTNTPATVHSSLAETLWLTDDGDVIPVDGTAQPQQMVISGRVVGKHLFLPEALVSHNSASGIPAEKGRKLETKLQLNTPGPVSRPLGTFSSSPMTIISKPSKKRANSKNSARAFSHVSCACYS